MYPVKLGFDEALRRARSLIQNGHHAEALVSAVFTVEKTLRRSLRYAIVARGFTSAQAEKLIDRSGLEDLKRLWTCFVPLEAQLAHLLTSQELERLKRAATMRNKLVHGVKAFTLAECRSQAQQVLEVLLKLRKGLQTHLGADGWSRLPSRRKAALGWFPTGDGGSTDISNQQRA